MVFEWRFCEGCVMSGPGYSVSFAGKILSTGTTLINAIARLRPSPHQHQVRRACRKQRKRERDMHSLAAGFEGRSHDGENIRRF
jgi:hypothetical protein